MQQVRTRDQAATVDWARRLIADPGTIYLDTETTGLGSDAEIVDVGVISWDGQVLLDTLVQPDRPIPADATAIHGITDEMVADAPAWKQVAPRLGLLIMSARNVVIYNADFDTRIMDQCNARCRMPRYRASWQCAMKQYAAYVGRIHERYGDYRWHKLTKAAADFGFRGAIQHRAAADAQLCRLVVHGMAGYEVR